MKKLKVAFKTLGCRLNQFETDSVMTDFYKSGYEIVPFADRADVYVINTCTVTNQGDHKSKVAINQAIRNKDGSLVIVTGCMAESQKEYLEDQSEIRYVIGNKAKGSILSLVDAHFNGELVDTRILPEDVFGFSVAEKSFHTRSMIKIQDGCDNFCSFCIVPMVRGSAVSRKPEAIYENIRQVTGMGYKELVLTGVNISRYDYDGLNFTGLLDKILNMKGQFRVRISSVEPEGFNNTLFKLFSHEKLCQHLHLCLQSGSDQILLQMRRKYNVSSYMKIVDELRSSYPLFNFTTDIMVGFPGESADYFESTCRIIRDAAFSHVHTFKYSVRKGTRAEKLPGQLPEKVKQERSAIVRELSMRNKLKYRQQFIGRDQTILVEKVGRQGVAKGYGEHYVPVEFKTTETQHNFFQKVNIQSVASSSADYILKAE